MKGAIVIILCVVFLLSLPAVARILNVPWEYATIQNAINNALEGDTVLVQPGTYEENIIFTGTNIVLGSLFLTTSDTSYISSTMIDGGGTSTVVAIVNGENRSTIVTGFTIQHGQGAGSPVYSGGGITCHDLSSPTISTNYIINNASFHGGGISCRNASNPLIEGCKISDNTSYITSGGVFCWDDCMPIIRYCTISNNDADLGGGIYIDNSDPMIYNCTLSGNSATDEGGGIGLDQAGGEIKNTIVEGSTGDGGIYFDNLSTTLIKYCDFYNNQNGSFTGSVPTGLGCIDTVNANDDSCDCFCNIFMDPCFVNPLLRDYHLLAESPCIDAGDPNAPLDPDGTVADIGAFYYNQLSVEEQTNSISPSAFLLRQNYPNPFNMSTIISYELFKPGVVSFKIFNVAGQCVSTNNVGLLQAGYYENVWQADNMSSGTYILYMRLSNREDSIKMTLLR